MNTCNIYVDESGNTGRDIYDLQQPLLTYAGVWMTEDEQGAAAAEVNRLVEHYRLQRRAEFKGKTVLKTNSGRQVIRDLLRWLNEQKISTSVIAVEKSSMAANVLVEDCTDYAYNSAYDARWTWDTRLKEPLGELIAQQAPRELLADAWRARHGSDKSAFERAYNAVLFAMSIDRDSRLASEAKRMQRVDLDELWSVTEHSRGTSGGYSPNYVAFTSMLMSAERHADATGMENVIVVHDEQQQYKEVFEQAWIIIRGDGVNQSRTMLPNRNEIVFGLRRLAGFRFDSSIASAGIQIADFVASAVRATLMEMRTSEASRTYLPELQALMRSQPPSNSPHVIGSESSWQLPAMSHLLGQRLRLK